MDSGISLCNRSRHPVCEMSYAIVAITLVPSISFEFWHLFLLICPMAASCWKIAAHGLLNFQNLEPFILNFPTCFRDVPLMHK
jgi:hypothetical protein